MSKKKRENEPKEPLEGMQAEQPAVEPEEDLPAAETDGDAEASASPDAKPGTDEPETYTLTREEFHTARDHIAKLQKEKDDTVALLQRNQADFDNFRRRNASIRADALSDGKRECIKELLPMLDNFDRAMANDAAADEAWRDGVKLVYRQMYDILHKLGMTEIEADGKFDPNLHDAVMQEQCDGKESGDIVAVFQKGYRVDDRIVRHSMVKVAE